MLTNDPRRAILINGQLTARLQYLIDHMWDECPKWPFSRASNGYGKLSVAGKEQYAHRVVCGFVHGPAPTPAHHAAHVCGKGHEGCFGAGCLSWKTPKENAADKIIHGTHLEGEDHGSSFLTAAQVSEIIELLHDRVPQLEIAERYGVGQMAISNINTGTTWKSIHRPYGVGTITTSRYRGVSWHRGCGKWLAQIQRNKKYNYLGLFDSEEEAAEAYRVASITFEGGRRYA